MSPTDSPTPKKAANGDGGNGKAPSEIELLLPFYAAGTLTEGEARKVESALASDPELAVRFEWVRAEFAEETALNEAAEPPPAYRDVAALFAKIDALPAAQPSRRAAAPGLSVRIGELLARLSPRTLAWSAAAAALAIVLQAGLLVGIAINERSGGAYQTASVPSEAAGDGSYVLIRFKPDASAEAIAVFLLTNKLTIVGGPTPSALFRVRVAPSKLAPLDLARLVNSLQDDKVVGFIAPTV